MKEKLSQYLTKEFSGYGDFPAKTEVIQELLTNLEEKYADLKDQGKTDEEAYQATVDSIGDVSEIMGHLPQPATAKKSESGIGGFFSDISEAMGLKNTGKFTQISLVKSDLDEVDLSGENFSGSDIHESSFKGAILVDAKFKGADVHGSNFTDANLTGAVISACDLHNVKFNGADMTNAQLKGDDLHGATFDSAILDGTNFSQSDLTDISFENQNLEDTVFDSSSLKRTSFRNATLHNVSFKYTAVKHAIFDGSTMDKVTYAILKGANAKLENVTVL